MFKIILINVLCLNAKNQKSRLQIINFKTTQLKILAACLSGRQAIQAVSEYLIMLYLIFVAETRGLLTMPPDIFNCLFCSVNDLRSVLRTERNAFHNFSKMVVRNDSPYKRVETFVTFNV